jgi:abhydrolase domain-containing protein 5
MGNKTTHELPDSYLYEPIKDFEKEDLPYNFKLKSFNILQPSQEALIERDRIESEILKLSDLEINENIWIEDIPIDFYGKNHIHTIRAQENKDFLNKKKPTIIMVHGFMASSLHYIKMLKHFNEDFNVYAIDIIGMGFSSRPQINFQDSKNLINFFVDFIEAFRIEIFKNYSEKDNDNKNFYLIGHSFGGYISTNYSIKYPKYIIKLFLLSPVGITDLKNNSEEDNKNNIKSFKRKVFDSIIYIIWPLKTTLQNLVNNFLFKNFIKKKLLNRYVINDQENELYKDLSFNTLSNYPKDLDWVIYYILKLPLPMAIFPLENVIPLRIKTFSIDIIYGTNDWMESLGAKRLCETYKENGQFNLFYMKSGRHTFNLERPNHTAKYILEGIERDNLIKSKNLNLIKRDNLEIEEI